MVFADFKRRIRFLVRRFWTPNSILFARYSPNIRLLFARYSILFARYLVWGSPTLIISEPRSSAALLTTLLTESSPYAPHVELCRSAWWTETPPPAWRVEAWWATEQRTVAAKYKLYWIYIANDTANIAKRPALFFHFIWNLIVTLLLFLTLSLKNLMLFPKHMTFTC